MGVVAIIISAAKSIGVSGALLLALCSHESANFTQDYVANDMGTPSFGVCQIKYATALQLGFRGMPHQLMDLRANVKWAAKYLKYQENRYGDDWIKIVASYNSGSYFPNKKNFGCPKNIEYVRMVQKRLPEDLRDRLNCGNVELARE